MLRDPRYDANTMVMHDLHHYFIRENGRTVRVERRVIEGRFGKLIVGLTLEFPRSWIDLDDDPRAEYAGALQIAPLARTVNQVDWAQRPKVT